jgi:DNA-binding NarL/FixJ family response regulator
MRIVRRILIIDDHPLLREGLKAILAHSQDYQVAAEAGTGRDGIELAKKLKPDVALLDITLPDNNGLKLISEIRKVSPRTRILIVSMHTKSDYIAEALRSGASGYLAKESASDKLLQALSVIATDQLFLDTSFSRDLVYSLLQYPDKMSKLSDEAYSRLTSREQEVLRYVAEGLSTKDIASTLRISPKTVENHRVNLMNKLGIHSAVELVRYAARLGLIELERWED